MHSKEPAPRVVEATLREGNIGSEAAGRLLRLYEDGFYGYTYLEDGNAR